MLPDFLLNRDLQRVGGDARGGELQRHRSRARQRSRQHHVDLIDAGIASVAGIQHRHIDSVHRHGTLPSPAACTPVA